jgi:hypothetical protein
MGGSATDISHDVLQRSPHFQEIGTMQVYHREGLIVGVVGWLGDPN